LNSASLGIAAFAVALFGAGLAGAQDFTASPNYGTIRLPGGSAPYPYVVEIIAGGAVHAADLGPNCGSLISEAPDLRIVYSASDLALALRAISDADTVLVANAPDGGWHCSADGAGGHNPALVFAQPLSGQYDIWVGASAAGVGWPARLEVSENSPN